MQEDALEAPPTQRVLGVLSAQLRALSLTSATSLPLEVDGLPEQV